MKKINRVLVNFGIMAVMPAIAGAAGTYYNGGAYQNRYGSGNGGYYNTYGMGRNYGKNQSATVRTTNTKITKKSSKSSKSESTSGKQGFYFDAGISHEFANWTFEMNKAGSKLHYDNLEWNVVSGNGVYYFDSATPVQINFGARYGMQSGESPMIDDDISSEKMWMTQGINVDGTIEYAVRGTPALSVGESKGGTQFGFNAGIGLTDFFKWGNMKITPSVGYRYFKYKLSTERNYGLMIEVLNSDLYTNCIEVQPGEIQCSPYMAFTDYSGETIYDFAHFATDDGKYVVDENGAYIILIPSGAPRVDPGETYYYEQSGKTHIYETVWSGPYLALDMNYKINENNHVTAGVEFGLPIYNSKGDQPYRYDWEHPTSVEDKGSFGDAYHLGLNSAWSTKITDSVALTLGFSYDYYNVKNATATTYYNKTFYTNLYNTYVTAYEEGRLTEEGVAFLEELDALMAARWTVKDDSEIKSVYKSMGIRLGFEFKF